MQTKTNFLPFLFQGQCNHDDRRFRRTKTHFLLLKNQSLLNGRIVFESRNLSQKMKNWELWIVLLFLKFLIEENKEKL